MFILGGSFQNLKHKSFGESPGEGFTFRPKSFSQFQAKSKNYPKIQHGYYRPQSVIFNSEIIKAQT